MSQKKKEVALRKKKPALIAKSFSSTMPDDWNSSGDGGYYSDEFKTWADANQLKTLFYSEDWVFTTVDLIARELSGIPRYVYAKNIDENGNEKLTIADKHPVNQLINNPNKYNSASEYRYLEGVEHCLMGNIIIWHAKSINELHIIPTENVGLEFDANKNLGNYYYLDNETNVKTKIFPNDIIHCKRPAPSSKYWGLSPFVPSRNSILFNKYSSEYLNAFYLKGATPTTILTLDRDASQEQINRLLKSFEIAYTGRKNMRRSMLLPKGVTANAIGSSIADQQLIDIIKLNRETILNVLHVPKHALGLQESGSLGSEEHKQSLKYFWQATIIPIDKSINESYNKHFKYALGDNYVIASAYEDIGILQDDLFKKADLGTKQLAFMTINEVRESLYGLPSIPGGDVIISLSTPAFPRFAQPQVQQAQPEEKPPVFPEDLLQEQSLFKDLDISVPVKCIGFMIKGLEYLQTHNKQVNKFYIDYANTVIEKKKLTIEQIKLAHEFFKNYYRYSENILENNIPANAKCASYLLGHTYGMEWIKDKYNSITRIEKANNINNQVKLEDDATLYEGFNENQELIKTLDLNIMIKAQEENEKQVIPNLEKLALDTLEKQYNIATDIVIDYLTKQDYKELTTKADNEEKVLRRKIKTAFDKLSPKYEEDYSKELTSTVETGYDSQLSFSFFGPSKDAIAALKERDTNKRSALLNAQGVNSFANISKASTDKIMNIVTSGLENQKTIRQITFDITENFKNISPSRAQTIARTEALTAYSIGQAAMAQNANEVIPGLKKMWVNTGDDRVRGNPGGLYPDSEFDHWHVQNDKPRDIDEPFSNGLMFPREPGGDAGNVINCRCSLITLVPEDINKI